MFFYLNPLYYTVIYAIISVNVVAYIYVIIIFKKFSKVENSKDIPGADLAHELLTKNGIENVGIVLVRKKYADHYDPRRKVLRLSREVYDGESLYAAGIAAHEVSHALQHAGGYPPMKLKYYLKYFSNIVSGISLPMIMFGFFFGMFFLIELAIILLAVILVFQILMLPMEFNANKRAIAIMSDNGAVTKEELSGMKYVLGAAAVGHVASAIFAVRGYFSD